jgi:NAD(P)-dependent dehydrogenase (short-subunit alcohol dehydrogenase family)
MNPFSLKDKTILIIGASGGIGRATAIACSQMGANVILTGRNKNALETTYKDLNQGNHLIKNLDLCQNYKEDLLKDLPDLHGFVYAAGISKRSPLKYITTEDLNNILHINFSAAVELTKILFQNKKLLRGASLVYISSVAAFYASLGHIMYMSSKAALNAFIRGTALELAPRGIRANGILPGMINTNLSPIIDNELREKDLVNYPLGRYGTPEEVAWAAVYLLSDATQWMTGSFLTLDGGLTLR